MREVGFLQGISDTEILWRYSRLELNCKLTVNVLRAERKNYFLCNLQPTRKKNEERRRRKEEKRGGRGVRKRRKKRVM